MAAGCIDRARLLPVDPVVGRPGIEEQVPVARRLGLHVYLPRHTALRATAALLHGALQPASGSRPCAAQPVFPRRHALHAARIHAEYVRVHHGNLRWRNPGDALR
ncbi:Histidine ABC transporter, ATP-binding protein HisP [Caballeronia sordidicola]|uniref:Histidine ABC transporter, ATP-binding protein HisP n=1 Tax=Caballeronia sordidicola TaxID=196367 RepID=A0A226X4F0_CABSO|nr:Histidine ABC transporter, ATP-binding protein HisP [Caballeronia sordidicola]